MYLSEIYRRHRNGREVDIFPYQVTMYTEMDGRINAVGTTNYANLVPNMDLESCAVMCYEREGCTHFDHLTVTNECVLVI